jgi:aminoglycoside phosphotransferase (APT) family kinase protein
MNNDVELTQVRDQHRFNENDLKEYLQQNLGADFSSMKVLQFEGGQSNPTFQITTPSGKYVVRKKPPGVLLKSAHAVDREYRVISALQGSGVPVPKTYLLCEDDAVIGTAFYVMEMVEGRVLIDSSLPSLSPEQRTALSRNFIESLAALHSVDFGKVGLDTFGKPGNYYTRQIHRWSQQYIASETEKNPAMDALMKWLPDNIPAGDESTIIHGDYRLPNCIVHPTKPEVSAILDWELSTIGHPLADLSYWCASEYHNESPFPDNYRELGRLPENELVQYYCDLTGRESIENWSFYIIFNLFRSAAIRQGVYKRGLDGNASSDHWQEMEQGGRIAAERGWRLVQDEGMA